MIIPGWRLRTKEEKRRQPVWVGDVAKAESWGELGQVESYLKAADRYTNSDLVFMCVKRMGDMAADAQLVLYDRNGERDPITGMPTDEARLDVGDHPFYELWNKPNPWDSKAEFLESLIITLLLSPKGVFVHLDDGERPAAGPGDTRRISLEKEPLAMWWLLPEAIKVIPGDDSMIKEYKHTIAGEKTIFEPEAILRLVEFNPINRYHSISRVQPANLSSASDLAGQRANWAMFKNSFRPSAVVEADKDFIDPDELALMEKLWEPRGPG
jgi:phage portal protein BeeE